MSLIGPYSKAVNEMVEYMVDAGFIVSAAAGNEAFDACYLSPGSAPEVTLRSVKIFYQF